MRKLSALLLAALTFAVSPLARADEVDIDAKAAGERAAGGTAEAGASKRTLPTIESARGRAELLHEAMHATLQVVHHEYFREDEGVTIPAATMKKVFRELARRHDVELRWLAVDTPPMNVDHVASDAFETGAVQALAAGKDSFERVVDGVYRRAGPITLSSDCLKCHLPNRMSTKDRAAGLVISIRVAE